MWGNSTVNKSEGSIYKKSLVFIKLCLYITFKSKYKSYSSFQGSFINDVTQEGGWNFCDIIYQGIGKTAVLLWQRVRGVSKSPNSRDLIYG